MLYESFLKFRRERPAEAAFLVTSGDRSLPITWKQFSDDIALVVKMIDTHVPGGTVAVLGENSYEWITVHAASLFAGAVAVPLDVNLTAQEIAERLRIVGAHVLVHSSLYDERVREVARLVPGLATGGFGTIKTDGMLEKMRGIFRRGAAGVWDEDAAARAKRFPRDPDGRPRTVMIVFTSGTTARPRGVELTLEGLEACVAQWSKALPMAVGSRSLMLLPLHHIFGISATYVFLSQGVALGVCPDFRRIYDAVQRFRVNFLALVPALADILAAKIEQHGVSTEEAVGTPLDWMLIGGAPLSRRTYERLTALGVKMLTVYGLTETASLFSIAPLDAEVRVGSAGRVPDGVEARVSPTGELLVRGPNVLKRYFREPERTAEAFDADGFFRTGDLGRIDADGWVWITGRASRTIVLSSGKKVAPEELEEKLLALPGVREAVVSGDGATRDLRAEIYATVPEAAVQHAVGALNRSLPVYKRIREVTLRGEPFPRTASGKIRVAVPAPRETQEVEEVPVRPRRRLPVGGLLTLAFLAIAVAVLGFVPDYLESQGVQLPDSVRTVFRYVDVVGEILLVAFAVLVILRVKARQDK